MPATGQSSLPSSTSPAGAGSKMDQPVKQIALCMASPSHNMVTISTSAQARPSATVSVVSGSSVPASSTVPTTSATSFIQAGNSFNTTTGAIPGITQLGLMVTRYNPGDRPTVLLQPRTPSAGRAVVVSSPNSAVGQRIVQIPNTSIRTIVQAGASSAQAVQGTHSSSGVHVNITPVSNPPQAVVKSTGIPNSTSNRNLSTIPLESGCIVLANDGANSRQQFRIHQPASVKVARSPNSSIQQAKLINLTSASVVNSTSQLPNSNVARLGIIQSNSSGSNNKTGSIISVTMPKSQAAVIINPQTGHPTAGNFTASNQTTHARPALIPVNSTVLTTLTGTGQVSRHTIISAGSSTPSNQSTLAPQRIITTQHPVQSQPIVTIAGSSPIKSAITTSPIKQSIPTATPPSPRPSILTRKRNFTDPVPGQGSSNASSQPSKACTTAPTTPVKIPNKQPVNESDRTDAACNDVVDGLPDSSSLTISSSQASSNDIVTTPRKRTRKQLLEPFNPTKSSANIRLLPSTGEEKQTPSNRTVIHSMYPNNESSMQVTERSDEDEQMESDDASQEDAAESPVIMPSNTNRPRLSMLNSYALPSKSLQYHFLRYTDVKPKPEKKLTLSELSNQVLQKRNGWKIHHLSAQLEDTSNNEAEILARLQKILDTFEQESSKIPPDDELPLGSNRLPVKVSLRDRLSDLIRGNIQRSVIYQDQSTESRQLLIKLTNDHREKVAKLTKKNLNKRTCISK